MDLNFALLALFVFLGFMTQTMAGFGAMLIALTLSATIMPVSELLPVLVPLSLLQGLIIAGRHFRHIDWRLLLIQILPLMAIGAGVGLALFDWLDGPWLKLALGVLVVLFAISELFKLFRKPREVDPEVEAQPNPLPKPLAILVMLGSGVTQGVYATGGPLLVYVVGRLQLDKGVFRATLTTAFSLINIGLVTTYVAQQKLTTAQLPDLALLTPVLLVAYFAGEWLHDRVDERRFRISVFSLLLLAGLALIGDAGPKAFG